MSTQRVLPADVYDTLEFAALAFGGIGWGPYLQDGDPNCPVCVHGLLVAASESDTEVSRLATFFREDTPLSKTLQNVGVFGLTSDWAVRDIIRRKHGNEWGKDADGLSSRVSFSEWCAELNIVRGD